MTLFRRPARAVPPPEPDEARLLAEYGPTAHGDTRRQAGGREPTWPEDWRERYPLDEAVWGPSE